MITSKADTAPCILTGLHRHLHYQLRLSTRNWTPGNLHAIVSSEYEDATVITKKSNAQPKSKEERSRQALHDRRVSFSALGVVRSALSH